MPAGCREDFQHEKHDRRGEPNNPAANSYPIGHCFYRLVAGRSIMLESFT